MASTAAAPPSEWLAVCFGKRSRNLISALRPRCPSSCHVPPPTPAPPPTPGIDVLKFHPLNRLKRPSGQTDQHREQVRRRQMLTVIFAILLISIAGISSAQSPPREDLSDSNAMLQYDGATSAPIAHPDAVVDAARFAGGAIQSNRLTGDARPTYVDMNASLANFDSDADPDGWRAEVVLFDRHDRPVAMRAHAKFELIVRVSTAERLSFVNADIPPLRWSMPLEFDQDAVARVRLPLRETLQPLFGWNSAINRPPRGLPTSISQNYARGRSNWSRPRTFVTEDLRTLVALPSTGELRVRVSVPTEGVFEAAIPIWLRPSGLVDTRWPYR